MDLCGLIDAFLELGYPAPGLNIGLHGSGGAAVDLRQVDSRYPYMLVIPQNETESILEDRINREGLYIDRGCQFVTLRQSETGVTAIVRKREEIDEELRADYVIGCDGTHSTVRDSIGMLFEGTEIDWTAFLADAKLDAHFIRSRITNFTGRRGFVSILPFMGEYARIFAVDFEKQDVDVHEELTLPDLQDTIDAVLPDRVTLHDPRWITRFRSPSREVPSMRKGRVFLAGDAAHSHTPAGGQGMNSGLQDAYNLGWRLASVLRGEAPGELLDGYHEERHAVNRQIQHETDQMFRSFVLKNPVLKAGHDLLLRSLLPIPHVQKTLSADLSNLGVEYTFTKASEKERNREHGIGGGLRPGQRVPDADLWLPGRPYLRLYERLRSPSMSLFALVVADRLDAERDSVSSFMETVEGAFGDHLSRTVIMNEGLPEEVRVPADVLVDHKGQFASRTGAKHGSLLLIRPDGHLAFHRSGWDPDTVLEDIEPWLTGTKVRIAR